MPDIKDDDDQNDDLNVDDDNEDLDDESTDDDNDDSSDDDKSPKDKSDKRVKDLQSKADAETARANKAEAALKVALARGKSGDGGSNDPANEALVLELREASLDAIFGEYPDLKEYSIDRSLIEGTTRAEMRDAATALVGLIKSVSSKARNKALAEAGVKADPAGAVRSKPVNYETMPRDEFLKLLENNEI